MKKDYFHVVLKPKEIQNEAYQSYATQIQQTFQSIKKEYTIIKCEILKRKLNLQSACKQLQKEDKAPIFEYFLNEQLKTFLSLKSQSSLTLSILKLTKCKLDNFKIDWKEFWLSFIEKCPEIYYKKQPYIKLFLKVIKPFFDENNVIEVYKYFTTYHPDHKISFITHFMNITAKTKEDIFNDFISLIINECSVGKMKKTELMEMFIWSIKVRKELNIPEAQITYLNNILIQLLTVPKFPRVQIQSRFNKTNALVLSFLIGKKNSGSISLLKTVFMFLKQFIRPLQNSTHAVKFLNNFIKWLYNRQKTQKKAREKLKKLKQKLQEKQDEEEEEQKNEQEEKEELLQQQKDEDEEQIKIDENEEQFDKPTTIEDKIQKFQTILSNQLTPQILKLFEDFINEMFETLYFVNSENLIPQMMKNLYRLYPSLLVKSFTMLDKAQQIPNINDEGLIKIMTVEIQNMFGDDFSNDSLKRILRILENVAQCRKISDVWTLYESLCSKIPLLDDGDIEKIPEEEKEYFETHYGQNFDRFYEQYSESAFEAYKKFLSEGQFMEQSMYKKLINGVEEMYTNSYPKMKQRLVKQTLNTVLNNPHKAAFTLFLFADLNQNQVELIKSQFSELKSESKEIESLKLNLLSILSNTYEFSDLKEHIYEMNKKGHFEPLEDYIKNQCGEYYLWQPLPASLKFLKEKIPIKLILGNNEKKTRKVIIQLKDFCQQLLKSLSESIENYPKQEQQNKGVVEKVKSLYEITENPKTYNERKNIYEKLRLLDKILSTMDNDFMTIEDNKLQIKEFNFMDIGFMRGKRQDLFIKIAQKLQLLADPKINKVLLQILSFEIYLPELIIDNEKKKIAKQKNITKNLESQNCENRIRFGYQYLSKGRIYILSKIINTMKFNVQNIKEHIFTLMMFNDSDNTRCMFRMLLENGFESYIIEKLIQLYEKGTQDRHLLKRLNEILDLVGKAHLQLTQQQIQKLISSHIALITSSKDKVREAGLKSFKKVISVLSYHTFNKELTQKMKKYIKIQKMEMVWVIWVLSLVTSLTNVQDVQKTTNQLLQILPTFEGLILHEIRTTRRMAFLAYSLIVRKIKKLNQKKTMKSFEQDLQEKSITQFFKTGYLRPGFENKYLKNRLTHLKYPSQAHQEKISYEFEPQFFKFLIDSPEKSMQFVKNFHSDMASTTQLLNSAIMSSMFTQDFTAVATKAVEKSYIFIKPEKMKYSRIQLFFGEKFFRYLCIQDANNGFKFFQNVKEFVLSCATNLQSLDSQTLIFCYTMNLLKSYQKSFKGKVQEVEAFLSKILQEVINKSSGAIFKKITGLIFLKIQNFEALEFIKKLAQEMIEKKVKVSRAGQILQRLSYKDIQVSISICKLLLDNQIQLQNQYFEGLLVSIISHSQDTIYDIETIRKTKIINLEKGLESGQIKQYNGYVLRNYEDFYEYIIKKLSGFIQKNLQMCKCGFNIITTTLLTCGKLLPMQMNLKFILNLLKLGIKVINNQNQLHLDYEAFYRNASILVGSVRLPPTLFQPVFTQFLSVIEPKKRCCDLVQALTIRPSNLMELSPQVLDIFIEKIISFESNTLLYKKTLKILSLVLSLKENSLEIIKAFNLTSNNQKALLYQAYCLANTKLDIQITEEVLKISSKERRTMWAKQMLSVHRKRQYFDSEEASHLWREIKAESNPYHYHA